MFLRLLPLVRQRSRFLKRRLRPLKRAYLFTLNPVSHYQNQVSQERGQKIVCPTALGCAKLSTYKVIMDERIKKAELARRPGCHAPQVDRLFDLRHASKFDQIEAAAVVLNRHIEIRIVA